MKISFYNQESLLEGDMFLIYHVCFLIWWLEDNRYKVYDFYRDHNNYLKNIYNSFLPDFEKKLSIIFQLKQKRYSRKMQLKSF